MNSVPNKPICQLKSHLGAVNVVKYNSTGEYCLSGGMDRSIKLWNPTHSSPDDRLIQTFKGHGWEVFDLNLVSGLKIIPDLFQEVEINQFFSGMLPHAKSRGSSLGILS